MKISKFGQNCTILKAKGLDLSACYGIVDFCPGFIILRYKLLTLIDQKLGHNCITICRQIYCTMYLDLFVLQIVIRGSEVHITNTWGKKINSYVSGNEVLLARICVPFDENMAIFCPIMKWKDIVSFVYKRIKLE